MFRHLEAIIRSRFGYPEAGEEFGWLAATQTLLPLTLLFQYTYKHNGDDPPK